MRDVAERAGVSTTTVSHVINNTRFVHEDSRQRVQEAMEELGYQPNALARGLRRSQTCTIAVIVPDSADPFFTEVIRGIEDVSFEQEYTMILCNSDGDLEKERRYTDLLTEKRVDGILFFASSSQSQAHVRVLQKRGFPLVIVDRQVPDIEADTVIIDNQAGGQMAAQHLLALGHRRIACISGPSNLLLSEERLNGYRLALAEYNSPVEESWIKIVPEYNYQVGFDAAQELLSLAQPPTAIFAFNDILAVGVINAATKMGIQVPAQLSVIGFDDLRLAPYVNPALTTIAQPKYEMGVVATTMLLERITDQELAPRMQLLDLELLVRESTAYV
ncbi:MAG: LacI family transcriptional regulator [Anaerolineae bacterium]|nr:LacI family transcriptional regulator [Anaerolineae bacterium]